MELISWLFHQRNEVLHSERNRFLAFECPDNYPSRSCDPKTICEATCRIMLRTVFGNSFLYTVWLTNRDYSLSVLLKSYINLNSVFIFAYSLHVLSIWLMFSTGLKLIFLFAHNLHMLSILLTSQFDLKGFVLLASRMHVPSVLLTSFNCLNFVLSSLSVFITSVCFVLLSLISAVVVFCAALALNLSFLVLYQSLRRWWSF